MGPCLENPHLCWTSRLLGVILLLSICSTVARSSGARGSGVKDFGAHFPLKGIRGGSVLFLVATKPGVDPGAKLEEISWGFGPESDYRVMLRVHSGADAPAWISLQDKYKQRVHVPNVTSLRIEDLTPQDSGQYRAQAKYPGGREFIQVFHLIVYEPVPSPQILVKPLSITPGWCNVTLECGAPGATEDMNVTWESKDLPRELEWRGTWRPAPNLWTLAVSLPLSQPNTSLTCVVSNQVDQKNATSDLEEVCNQGSHGQSMANLLPGILGTTVAVLLILCAGLYLWKTREKKKMETGRGAGLQEDHMEDDGGIYYADLMEKASQEGKDKAISEQHLEEKGPLNTVYSEVHNPGQAMKIIQLEEAGVSGTGGTPAL